MWSVNSFKRTRNWESLLTSAVILRNKKRMKHLLMSPLSLSFIQFGSITLQDQAYPVLPVFLLRLQILFFSFASPTTTITTTTTTTTTTSTTTWCTGAAICCYSQHGWLALGKGFTYFWTNTNGKKLFLPWKSNKYYIFLCVCVCVCGGEVMVPRRMGVCICVRTCRLAYPPCNAHASYSIVICGLSGSTIFFDIIS